MCVCVCMMVSVWVRVCVIGQCDAVIWAPDADSRCRPMAAQGGQKGEGRASEADSICNEGSDELGFRSGLPLSL